MIGNSNDVNYVVIWEAIERLETQGKITVELINSELHYRLVTDLNEMAERIVKSLNPVALNKSVNLMLHTDSEVLAMVDREKFWQVIYNVTDNAIKYTPEGGNVSLYVFGEGDYVRIEIIDTGIGIPEEQVDKIFDRFYRVDKARSRESGGTGLGLSIVKDVVDSHNGKILVDSKENDGTKFVIIIPKNL
jgi:two-component system sensor histidine kinase VicK